MITKQQVELARVILFQLEKLYEETKNPDSNEYSQRDLLTKICGDTKDLAADIWNIWRDIR